MLQVDVEAWAYRVIRGAEQKHSVEDARVELKSNWPDARDVARQLAAHANAAAGEPILWLLGVDEKTGVVPYAARNMADWRPQLEAEFEGVVPSMQHFALRWNDQPFEALVFATDAPPYVIRNPKRGGKDSGPFDFEVPWRDGRTRSARRAELILMLRPIGRAPSFSALGANVQLLSTGQLLVSAHLYAESPTQQRILMPSVKGIIDFGESSVELSEIDQFGDGQDPDVIRTRSHLIVNGAGKVVIRASGHVSPQPKIFSQVTLRLMFRIATIPQPVVSTIAVPSVPLDGSTTGEVAHWRFGIA